MNFENSCNSNFIKISSNSSNYSFLNWDFSFFAFLKPSTSLLNKNHHRTSHESPKSDDEKKEVPLNKKFQITVEPPSMCTVVKPDNKEEQQQEQQQRKQDR